MFDVSLRVEPASCTWDELVDSQFKACGGLRWLSRGDTVLLKPACNSGRPHPSATHPEAVGAMARYLKEHGAHVIVGDQSGVEHVQLGRDHQKGHSRQLLEASGIAAAALQAGATVVAFEEKGYDAGYIEEKPDFPSVWEGAWLTRVVHEVDHIINMPRLSAHLLATYTCGLKNVVGYLRHDSRQVFHEDGALFFPRFVDINHFPSLRAKVRATFTFADKVLLKTGPDKGKTVPFSEPGDRVSLASFDLGAHDALAFALIEWVNSRHQSIMDTLLYQHLPRTLLNRFLTFMIWRSKAGSIPPYPRDASFAEDPVLSRWWTLQGGLPEKVTVHAGGAALPEELGPWLKKRRAVFDITAQ